MRAAIAMMIERRKTRPGAATAVDLVEGDAITLAADPQALAILGPFRSADTAAALPTVNRYGVPLVSASNTYVPLTSPGPSFEPDEPARYYTHGPRTYVRLFPNDFHQAAALVQVAQSLGVRRPFVVHDNAPYGLALSVGFSRAAVSAGLHLAGSESGSTDALDHVARHDADALVWCGVLDPQFRALIEEKPRRFGANDELKLLGADGLLTG